MLIYDDIRFKLNNVKPKLDDLKLAEIVRKHFDMRPAAMIEQLDLRKPVYQQVAAYGHMGREDLGVKCEITDRTEALKAALGL